jgi:hypothetical protein
MDKATHSSRISLGALEDHVHALRDSNLESQKPNFHEWRPRWWDSLGPTDCRAVLLVTTIECIEVLEAAIGIEPMNKGFAEIYQHRSLKNTEEQVHTKTTL